MKYLSLFWADALMRSTVLMVFWLILSTIFWRNIMGNSVSSVRSNPNPNTPTLSAQVPSAEGRVDRRASVVSSGLQLTGSVSSTDPQQTLTDPHRPRVHNLVLNSSNAVGATVFVNESLDELMKKQNKIVEEIRLIEAMLKGPRISNLPPGHKSKCALEDTQARLLVEMNQVMLKINELKNAGSSNRT
jgi:hypothetical protein